jgi:NADPH2:quinone reductase
MEAAGMRVAQISEFGGIEALRLEEAAEPEPGPGEVLIKVTAAGLNFSDTLILHNKYQVTPALPFSPGAEIAGSIEGMGAGVTDFKVGERVVAVTGMAAASGQTKTANVFPFPGVSDEQAPPPVTWHRPARSEGSGGWQGEPLRSSARPEGRV